jgi:hypothetical protein
MAWFIYWWFAFAEETSKRVCSISQYEYVIVRVTNANGSDVAMRISLWKMKSSKHKSKSKIQARKGCFAATESATCLEFQVHKH